MFYQKTRSLHAILSMLLSFVFISTAWAAQYDDQVITKEFGITQSTAQVDIVMHKTEAYERGPTPGFLQLTRTGDLEEPLEVAFEVTGQASRDIDYRVLDPMIRFESGSATTAIGLLPLNDSAAESNESIEFRLLEGLDYTVGSNNQVTTELVDAPRTGFSGVYDWLNDLGPNLEPDIVALDARIDSGTLHVGIWMKQLFNLQSINVFLDTDQNPLTGDHRPNKVKGSEYQISVRDLMGEIISFYLYKLPTTTDGEELLVYTTTGPNQFIYYEPNGGFRINVPVSLLGEPNAVDVLAIAYPTIEGTLPANDRAPDYGVFDTATSQVVVRDAKPTRVNVLVDEIGDAPPFEPDIQNVQIESIGDQTEFTIEFDRPLTGFFQKIEILIDSDHSLSTGNFFMGDDVPTWGGDVKLLLFPSEGILSITGQIDSSFSEPLGGDDDAIFAINDNILKIRCATNLLDPFQVFVEHDRTFCVDRVSASSNMLLTVRLLDLTNNIMDTAPQEGWAFDTRTGRAMPPLAFLPSEPPIFDPQDMWDEGDIKQVGYQVVDGKLIVRITFYPNYPFFLYHTWVNILFDTDNNPQTGDWFFNEQLGSSLGADLIFEALEDHGGFLLEKPSDRTESLNGLVRLNKDTQSVTVSVPLEKLEPLSNRLTMAVATKGIYSPDYDDYTRIITIELDPSNSAPTVISTSPTDEATGVELASAITATFSEAMDAATITSSTFTLNNDVTGTVTYNPSTLTATFTPTQNLASNTTYTVTITTGVKDTTGNLMAANKGWSFTTVVENLPNLVTYRPSGWSDKIVVSTTTGTNTDTMPLTETDILYIDWAVLNDSTIPILTQHCYTLYVDGVEKQVWSSPELNPRYYNNVIDFSIGKLSAGTHEIKIVANSTEVISEKNESDNCYIKTITVERRVTDLATRNGTY